jgi:hypothetical protein
MKPPVRYLAEALIPALSSLYRTISIFRAANFNRMLQALEWMPV